MREMHSKRPKFSKFSGGACPHTPLEALALRCSLKMPWASFSIPPPTSQILPSTPFLIENPAPSWKTAFFNQINLYKVDYSDKTDETSLQSNCKFSFRPIHNNSKEETWVLTHLVMCWRCILYMRMGLWILRLHSEERADSWVSHLHTSSYEQFWWSFQT